MATNQELQETIKEKNKKIKDLENQIIELQRDKEEAQDQIAEPKPGGMSGYVITTSNKGYNGVTFAAGRGIQFRRGRAIVLDGPEAPAIVSILRNDYGYTVIHTNNIQEMPETAEAVKKELSEIIQ